VHETETLILVFVLDYSLEMLEMYHFISGQSEPSNGAVHDVKKLFIAQSDLNLSSVDDLQQTLRVL